MDIILFLSQIVWVVLQIVFFLLLFILILLLVIICTNLKYQFKTSTKDYYVDDDSNKKSLDFDLKMTYLFSGIKVFANKKDNKIKILVKIFGFSVFKNVIHSSLADNFIYDNPKEEGVNTNEKEKDEEKQKQPQKEDNENNKNEEKTNEKEDDEKAEGNSNRTCKIAENSDSESTDNNSNILEGTKEERREDAREEKSVKSEKNQKKKENTSSKKKKPGCLKTLLSAEFIGGAFKALVKFLKTFKPEKFVIRLKLGFENPSITGKIVGLCYTIGGATGLDILCEGEFQKKIDPDIFFYMRGKLSIFKLIKPFLILAGLFIKLETKRLFKVLRRKGERLWQTLLQKA